MTTPNENPDLPTWHEAMALAGARLRMLEEKIGLGHRGVAELHVEITRAWIAYAQEVTSHQALQRDGSGGERDPRRSS